MYATSCEKRDISFDSEIVALSKSHCGKFLGILSRKSVEIRSLIQINLPLIDAFQRKAKSMKKGGFNHWIQWVNSNSLAVGTQSGYVFFISLDDNGKIKETKNMIFKDVITAHSSVFNALVIATTGPKLYFISPQGEIVSNIAFKGEVPVIIRDMGICESLAVFAFSDGTAAYCQMKESCIVNHRPLSVEFLPASDVSSVMLENNKSLIALQTFKGMLMSISAQNELHELAVICDNSSLFKPTRDFSFLVSLAADGALSVWSNKTKRISTTKLDFSAFIDPSNPKPLNFIASEIDLYGLRYFIATESMVFEITFAICDNYSPSLLFHTPTYIVVPTTNVTIYAPFEMVSNGYPLHSVAYAPDLRKTAIAGRKCFALYTESSNSWHLVKDQNNLCRALWYHKKYFVSVVFDFENTQYRVLLINPSDFTVIDGGILDGAFIDYDNKQSHFAIATSNSISIFRIDDIPYQPNQLNPSNLQNQQVPPDQQAPQNPRAQPSIPTSSSKIVLTKQYEVPRVEQIVLYHNNQTVAALTSEKELVEYPSKKVLMEGVSFVDICKEIDMLAVIAHGQQFVVYNGTIIRINSDPGLILDGANILSLPKEYQCGKFEFQQHSFLMNVIIAFLDQPQTLHTIISAFITSRNIVTTMALSINLALKIGKFDPILNELNNFPEAKTSFLLIALLTSDDQNIETIKSNLPSPQYLLQQFPNFAPQIRHVYHIQ